MEREIQGSGETGPSGAGEEVMCEESHGVGVVGCGRNARVRRT